MNRQANASRSLGKPTFGWGVRFLPSLTDVVILFPLLFLLLKMQGVSTLLGDGDTGWHIRTGEWILQHGTVPHVDIFSFSKPGQPWFAWEWGWDACFALIHQAGGLSAVVFVNIILLGVVFALLFRLVRRECSNDVVSVLVTIVALAGTSIHWLARPHLVSWLFVVVFCHVLTRAAQGRTGLLWCLPFLMFLWTNLHGGFLLGIALVFAYMADPLVRIFTGSRPGTYSDVLPFGLCGIACFAASFVNPYGYGLHQHVIAYLLDSKQLENILEFRSISFQHPLARYFEVMLAVGTIAAFHSLKLGRVTEALIVVVWAHLALASIRNIPIFLLFAAPMVARAIAGWIEGFPRIASIGSEFRVLERFPRSHVVSLAAFALLFVAMFAPGEAKLLRSEYDPAKYPAKAVERLRGTASSNVFTDDEWGDYLIYKMYPTGRVFVDGRSDFYGAEFENRYLDLMNVKYDWEQGLNQYNIDTVLLRVEAPLASVLKESHRWTVAYDDGVALIFLRGNSRDFLRVQKDSPLRPDEGKDSETSSSRIRQQSGFKKLLKGEQHL